MNLRFRNFLLKTTHAQDCNEVDVIQSLWSGYGKISRYQLSEGDMENVVVKSITLNRIDNHPRGWNTNFSHNRKVKSYEVETNWYKAWSKTCPENCRIPKFLGAFSEENEQWIIMEDLNTHFPDRKHEISFSEVKVCLKWLANFHGTFLNREPDNLWEVGTYWHLKTRPDEFEKMQHLELKKKAHLIDEILNDCRYKTIVHGDAKLANFCFSKDGKKVAAVDFQYVGGGCGIKDVVYFLGSCLSGAECELYETELLNYYFLELKKALPQAVDFKELEEEWRKMYPIASADFTRFLLGWMPSHQKLNDYSLKLMEMTLEKLLNSKSLK